MLNYQTVRCTSGDEVYVHTLMFHLGLDGDEWSASRPDRSNSMESALAAH
jgi:hypothetical protein